VNRRARATPAEAARRDDKVLEYWLAGYSQQQIARALDMEPTGVVVTLDRVAPGRPRNVRQRRMDDPKPYDWHVEPEPEVGGEVLSVITSFVTAMKGINYRNQFAHAAREGTPQWVAGSQRVLSELQDVAGSLQRILDDPAYREEVARTSAGRDDLPPVLTYGEMVERSVPFIEARPGIRRREIARELGLHAQDPKFIKAVAEARNQVRGH
jgi:hypothetical protein